jgi:branched-chain amino acid transport system substrate-binding protein
LAQARPDAIFNVLFGPDLTAFVREGNTRGLFERRFVLSLLTGEPEYMIPLGDETPEGWVVTGYPWEQVEGAEHRAFIEAYRARFNDTPRKGSLLGYVTVQVLANMLNRANSLDNEVLVDTLRDLRTETVVGNVTMRGIDQQGSMGTWVGETTQRNGQGTMRNARYADGADYMFPEEEVRAARRA